MDEKLAILQLGTNKGNRLENLKKAINLLTVIVGKTGQVSSIYETAPWGNPDQANFLNLCLEVYTQMDPFLLLEAAKKIEGVLGRDFEAEKWTAREMDIDILFFEDEIIESKDLVIPHPFLQERAFVLIPLEEIAPSRVHPKMNQNITDLLKTCADTLTVKKFADSING